MHCTDTKTKKKKNTNHGNFEKVIFFFLNKVLIDEKSASFDVWCENNISVERIAFLLYICTEYPNVSYKSLNYLIHIVDFLFLMRDFTSVPIGYWL